ARCSRKAWAFAAGRARCARWSRGRARARARARSSSTLRRARNVSLDLPLARSFVVHPTHSARGSAVLRVLLLKRGRGLEHVKDALVLVGGLRLFLVLGVILGRGLRLRRTSVFVRRRARGVLVVARAAFLLVFVRVVRAALLFAAAVLAGLGRFRTVA